jgi:hypothetical protein
MKIVTVRLKVIKLSSARSIFVVLLLIIDLMFAKMIIEKYIAIPKNKINFGIMSESTFTQGVIIKLMTALVIERIRIL